ncbi:MAG TPA: signal peptidase II [Verrucomicrobiae bacterium]|jgi:signal peptidase II|nr:signal peptidase II [Verrucomicrobiae bacterium]
MTRSPTFRIGALALVVLALDQITKRLVLQYIDPDRPRVVIKGFFCLVNWANTGAAWSMFMGNNRVLAFVALAALVVLFLSRHYFDAHTLLGQISLGLIFGGILGNLIDRVVVKHVTDFLYFYLQRRGGGVLDFPAFNVADSAICIGVGLMFILSWKSEKGMPKRAEPQPGKI